MKIIKTLMILGVVGLLFIGCNEKTRYTQQSPEIDTVKKLIANYNGKNYDLSIYADTSKTNYNSKENTMSPTETMAYHNQSDEAYSSRKFLNENQEYEMVITDDGETWVNCWLDWQGILDGSGKEINIPIHLTYQFVNGKIVREVGHWDPTEVVLAMQDTEARNAMSTDEKAIMLTIDVINKVWNRNNGDGMTSVMLPLFSRTDNGITSTTNTEEYAGFVDSYHQAFPDFTVTIDEKTIIANKAYLNWTCTGTNTGNFMENEPTGEKIQTHGISVWTFDQDGKAISENAFYDNILVFNQLNLQPPKE